MENKPLYTLEQIMAPLWEADTVYDERLLFVRQPDGTAKAPLLYKPIKLLEVTDAEHTVTYEEGRDYTCEDGQICLTENSRIFAFTPNELFPKEPEKGASFPLPNGNLLFHEGEFFHLRQTSVTYTCVPDWSGCRPSFCGGLLPRTVALLKEKKPINILLYGDSISACANASGVKGWAPFQPDYGTLLIQSLEQHYGTKINYTNTSVGGKETVWAIKNIEENAVSHRPDLAIIAFGMNDGGKTPQDFAANLRTIIEKIRAAVPNCEFLLVATTLPNRLLTDPAAPFWGNQENFYPVMKEIEADTKGVAVANMTAMHRDLLQRKRFIDLTTNHVNHPNDFLYRFQAQFLFNMLAK
ncbi:MAG: SGNH/GDSL hydrolase family protein [Clostridia bacterium]|nr:SGNH/GDSL hydrolase family protein [Clostridia bacterium]